LSETNCMSKKVFTIPNILSMVRIALIPIIVWLYHVKNNPTVAAAVVVVSGITDVVDGIIARKFNMISDLGKALDPIADKLTQTTLLVCLLFRFPLMGLPLSLLVVKEFVSGIWRLIIIRRTKEVRGAKWHGKAATVLLYGMMLLHILWPAMPEIYSLASVVLCALMLLLSFLLYSIENYRTLKDAPCRAAHGG